MSKTQRSESERLFLVISEELGIEIEKVTAHADLREKLGADSLDLVEVSLAIEEEFDVMIPDADLTDWAIVADVAKTLTALLHPPEDP